MQEKIIDLDQDEMNEKVKNISQFIKHVDAAMKVIESYEASRPGSLSFTKLEEAILWAQVMVNQIPLKVVEEKNDNEEVIIA
jgi:hypothetical protein